MEITLFGVITIVISIYAFFRNEKLLLYMMVFLSTFTAAELLHINITTTPLQTFEFTGAMWLLREFINFIKAKPKINKETIIENLKKNKLASAFIMFIIAIMLGEVYLLISRISVPYTDIFGEPAILKFSMSNITQAIIIIFVFVIMTVLSFKIKTRQEVKDLLKVFCISSIFAVIWGLLQFITFYFGIPYPAFLFNNNIYAAQGFEQISNNIKRICSIALEPSTFAVNLICFLPFVIGTFLSLKNKFKDKKYIITFVLLILTTACAILSTSSTTYIGLVAIYGLFGVYILFAFVKNGVFSNRLSNFLKLLIITVVSCALALGLSVGFVKIGYKLNTIAPLPVVEQKEEDKKQEGEEVKYQSAFQNMARTIKQMTIDKLTSGSGQERMSMEEKGFSLFKYSPIFGLGFGSFRTFSLFTNILINTGILGIIIYLYMIFITVKELFKNRKEDEGLNIMFLVSIIGGTISFCAGVPDLVLTFYWIIMVLGYKYATLDK